MVESFGKGEGCRYFCQDETRLGLITIPGKMITLKGVKPKGSMQWKRENYYLYGAVEPLTGESYFYEFSHLDRYCFQKFVEQLSKQFPNSLNFLQLDNAAFHQNIDWPENVIPIFQPKYSPELNPIERFWEEIKRKLRWKNCKTLEELRQNVSNVLAQFDPASIRSLIGWDFLTEAILSATS